MIRGDHTYIRGTEQDDVELLYRLYMQGPPRAGLLDARREPLLPNRDEIRDLLTRKEIADGSFYTVEDTTGDIVGFCSLRGHSAEGRFAEYSIQFADTSLYDTPLAGEAHAFLLDRAFVRLGMRKVLAYALEKETELRDFLLRQGFRSAGVQRQVLYTGGRWNDLETLALEHRAEHVDGPAAHAS